MQVGERYRDLIQAADTITEMKYTCEKIENVINNKKEPVSWNKNDNKRNVKDEQESSKDVYETAAQIKILMNLIESISTAIDESNFLEATQLFLLSRHISASLKLGGHSDIIGKFPVVRKVWDLISPFQSAIKTSCLQALEEKNINVEKTVNCIGSLILLESGEFTSSLDTFIQIREKAFLKTLTVENNEMVKEKLLDSVIELVNTTKIIYDTFVNYNGGEGLLVQKFNTLNSENLSTSLIAKNPFLTNTKLLSRFKFHCSPGVLDVDTVRKIVSKWMSSIEKIVQDKLKGVIKHIVSINTIREIENQIQNIEKPSLWPNICSTIFDLKHLDFYEKFYQALILERMYSIINISWDNIQSDFKNEIESLTILINDRVHRLSSYYIWMNDDSDNPQSLKDALNVEQQMHNLLMKVKGYNKHIVDICTKLDVNLKKLTDDLKQYVQSKSSKKKNQKTEDYSVPKDKLLNYLKDSSKANISSLITYVKSSVLINDVENCHILARLLTAIIEMCPNLKQCFSNNLLIDHTAYFEDSIFEDSDEWKEVTELLTKESIQLWRVWLTGFVNQWNILKVEDTQNSYNLIKEFPTWKSLIISEKGENDQHIDSKIHIPQQLSITTQCWIFNTINCMNKMIPHTLPKQIHEEIVEEFNKKLYVYYQALCSNKELVSNQKIAWQILFDLRVLIGLFTLRDNNDAENFQELSNQCKSIIDPFDFDVFYPHVINNIKENTSRLQYEMGLMVPCANYSILQNQSILHVHETEPNIIAMSSSQTEKNWIPLLPIITKTKGVTAEVDKSKVTNFKVLIYENLINVIYFFLSNNCRLKR